MLNWLFGGDSSDEEEKPDWTLALPTPVERANEELPPLGGYDYYRSKRSADRFRHIVSHIDDEGIEDEE